MPEKSASNVPNAPRSSLPIPGGGHERINVSQTLRELDMKDRDEQISSLEKVHQELSTRLNRAQA
ncbi:MAG: hypothetical protein GX037_04235 [Trueperella sp.]|nr:hypothetical protein [Trueperella sp.]